MSQNHQFQNKVAIVTGAGTGMGADTAMLLAERGAKVALVGRSEAPLQEVAAPSGASRAPRPWTGRRAASALMSCNRA